MTDAMTTQECIDSQTHAGSCCEGGRRPSVPFHQRKRIPVEETIAEESNAFPVSQCVVLPVDMTESDPVLQQLAETERLLQERAKDYGPPEINMTGIGLIWTAQLRNHYGIADLPVLSGQMVALMMAGLKLNRLAKSPGHQDSYDDLDGYAEIAKRLVK